MKLKGISELSLNFAVKQKITNHMAKSFTIASGALSLGYGLPKGTIFGTIYSRLVLHIGRPIMVVTTALSGAPFPGNPKLFGSVVKSKTTTASFHGVALTTTRHAGDT